jgi:hypothetical protein
MDDESKRLGLAWMSPVEAEARGPMTSPREGGLDGGLEAPKLRTCEAASTTPKAEALPRDIQEAARSPPELERAGYHLQQFGREHG